MNSPNQESPMRYPPRMVLKKGTSGAVEAVSLSYVFQPFPNKAVEYVSKIEVDALIAAARAEAKAEAFEEAANLSERVELSELVQRPKNRIFDYLWNTSVTLLEKAKQAREGK